MSGRSLPDVRQDSNITSSEKGNVFISYARDDDEFMRQLHTELSDLGRDVWVDWEDIKPGDDWFNDIYSNIEKTDTFLFLISPRSITSTMCNLEIKHAVEVNKRLVPILYEKVDFDKVIKEISSKTTTETAQSLLGSHDLLVLMRKNWRSISIPNWIDFSKKENFKECFDQLIQTIDTDLPYVREHTRWLLRAVEWDNKSRNKDLLVSGTQLTEAENWLANSESSDPSPTDLHRTYIIASRQEENSQQRTRNIVIALAFIVTLALAAFGLFQSQSAQTALNTAQARGTEVANSAATATNALGVAANNAFTAQANALIAQNNAATATNALGIAQARSTDVANQVVIAANNAATAQANALIAQYNAVTATYAQGQAQDQGNNAATQASIAKTQAGIAQDAADAEAIARATSVSNALTATNAQGQSQVQAAIAGTQAAIAQANAATAVAAQDEAQIQGNNAATQAAIAKTQAAIAQNAATAESNARATSVVNENNAVNNAGTAVVAQGQAVAAQSTAEKRSNEAQSVGLTIASEQLVSLGNTDLALVLALEAVRLDPKSWVAQSRLLTIAFAPGTRLVFKPSTTEPTHLPVSNSDTTLNLNAVTHLAYSPDGQYVASSSMNGTITLWDAHTGKSIRNFIGHNAAVNSIDFSPDSKMLISASSDKSLILWDVDSGHDERHFRLKNALGVDLNRPALSAVFRPDGETIVSGWDDGQVVVFDTDTAYDRLHLLVAKGPITHISLSPDAKAQFFLAISPANISVWDSKEAKQQHIYLGGGGVGAYSPDGNSILISASSPQIDNLDGNDLILRDLYSTTELKHYRGHTAPVTDVVFIQKGTQALSASKDGTVILWDIQSEKILRQYYGSGKILTSLAVNPDEASFVSADENGEVRLWDIESAGTKNMLPEVKNTVLGLKYTHDTRTILANYDDKSVGFQNAVDGSEGPRRFYHNDVITSFTYSPDEKNLLIADASGTVYSWNISTYSRIYDFSANGGSAVAAYSPDGMTVATGNALGYLRFWNALTGDRTILHEPDNGPITGILYFKDGNQLLTIHPNALVIRNSHSGNIIREIPSTLKLSRVALSPDEHYLLTSSGSDVILWDLTTERGTPKIFGGDGEPHIKLVTDLAFSPDGSTALSSSEDGSIRLWDVLNGRLLFVYSYGSHIPHGVVFNPDGRTFIAGYDRQIIVFWSGTRAALNDWITQHRYLPELTCVLRERYSLNPLCSAEGILPTITPTGTQPPTSIPTLTLAPSLTPTSTDVPPTLGRIVSQGRVNVRADKNNDSALLTQLNNGELVSVLDDASQTPGWVHIRTQSGIEGWISDQLIRIGDLAVVTLTVIPNTATPTIVATLTPIPTITPIATLMPTVTLHADNNGNINIRSGPNNDFKLVARVPSGTSAVVVDAPSGLAWTQIRLEDGTEGWVLRVVVMPVS